MPGATRDETVNAIGDPDTETRQKPIITAVFRQSQKMIFQRAIRRELTHSAAGVFTALFAIMITTQLIRLLNEAAQGSIEPAAVAACSASRRSIIWRTCCRCRRSSPFC